MNAGAQPEAGRDGQAPVQFAVNQQPDHPWQIDEASKQVVGEDEGWAGIGGALGKQIPGGVDEGGEDDERKREQRHETSVPSGAKKISTSPPLGFCPSGAAACYRGFRNARTGDGGFAIRNPSCHSVDGTLISKGIRCGQSGIYAAGAQFRANQAARSCNSSDEPRISTLRPFAVMTGASPFMAASSSAIRPSIVVRLMRGTREAGVRNAFNASHWDGVSS